MRYPVISQQKKTFAYCFVAIIVVIVVVVVVVVLRFKLIQKLMHLPSLQSEILTSTKITLRSLAPLDFSKNYYKELFTYTML